jgi:two-component sensor histidine kinase
LPGRWRITDGAVIVIQDVTDEVRKEQELRIKSAMIQEIHHRVKNNLQTIAALLRMQARRTSSDEVSVPLHQAESRIQSVAAVHAYLAREERAVINIHEVATRIIEEVTHGTLDPSKDIKIMLEGVPQLNLPGEEATSCALIINELLQNAVEHGYRDRDSGTIRVRLDETDDSMVAEICDDGAGLPEGFSLEKSSLGLQIVNMLVREQLKGHFTLESEQGVRALVTFPRWRGEGPLKSPRPVAAAN